jgi:hypothetical protein
MAPVPELRPRGQRSPTPDPAPCSPRCFVNFCEAREAFDDLAALALEATRPPRRRTIPRREARARLRKARASLAFLFSPASDGGGAR